MNITGIQYIPTKSLDEPSSDSGQYEVISQNHFSFNMENSFTPNNGTVNYLTIPINHLRVDDTNHLDKRYNTIVVTGFAMSSPNIGNSDIIRFKHTFVTDWNIIINVPTNIISPSLFTFQQTTDENDWVPVFNIGWQNGTNAVNGTYWDNNNHTVIGFSCGPEDEGGTVSNNTGPIGGVDATGGNPPFSPLNIRKFLYAETSSPYSNGSYVWVARSRPVNLFTQMDNTLNDAFLRFYVHGYGANMGDLEVFIDTNDTSNSTNATSIFTAGPNSNFDLEFNQTSNSSPYQQVNVNLNAYRTVNSNHYIYFVYQNNTSFYGDFALDRIIYMEQENELNFEEEYSSTVISSTAGNIVSNASIGINNITDNLSVKFNLVVPSKKIYVKGSYLLM